MPSSPFLTEFIFDHKQSNSAFALFRHRWSSGGRGVVSTSCFCRRVKVAELWCHPHNVPHFAVNCALQNISGSSVWGGITVDWTGMNPRSAGGASAADKNKLGQFLSSLGHKWRLTKGDSPFGDPPPRHKEAEFLEQENTSVCSWWVTVLQNSIIIQSAFDRSGHEMSSELICLCSTKHHPGVFSQ